MSWYVIMSNISRLCNKLCILFLCQIRLHNGFFISYAVLYTVLYYVNQRKRYKTTPEKFRCRNNQVISWNEHCPLVQIDSTVTKIKVFILKKINCDLWVQIAPCGQMDYIIVYWECINVVPQYLSYLMHCAMLCYLT